MWEKLSLFCFSVRTGCDHVSALGVVCDSDIAGRIARKRIFVHDAENVVRGIFQKIQPLSIARLCDGDKPVDPVGVKRRNRGRITLLQE